MWGGGGVGGGGFKVEAPITDHLEDCVLDLEKYKMVLNYHVKGS